MHGKKGKYDIGEEIYASPNSVLYAAVNTREGNSVILKTVTSGRYDAEGIAKLQGEYSRMARIENQQVLRPIEFIQQDGVYFLVMERFEGATLSSYLSFNMMSVERFLQIAVQIVKGLAAIHKQGMIHKDINPSNILYNSQTGEVKIIDFGIATEYKFERNDEIQINMGTLRYISPEQTRRMNRSIDFRTDFYSLGIVFYEMLCGRVPFDSDSPMGLIYSHLAKIPPMVHELRAEIPTILSEMIVRLMEKMPEDRYVSDAGILYDLEKCTDLLDLNGNIEPFTLGRYDHSEQLEISKRIYGRGKEIKRLLVIFEEFMLNGQCLLTIGGYSGTGKTSLVNQLHSEIAKTGGLFLEGKFDQYQRNIPYYAIFKAIEQLCDMMLSEPEGKLERFRTKLLKALGHDGELLARRIPKVAHLLKIKTVSEIGAEDSTSIEERIQFKNALVKLFHVAVSFSESLILFLDDIHLADMASLEILEELMINDGVRGIFVIACFRDNETRNDHPMLRTLQKIQFRGGYVRHIALKGIEQGAVLELIVDSLQCSIEESRELVEVVFEKTRGNPFYVIQMLRHCYAKGLIYFSHENNSFLYNIEKIRETPFEENVVDFLIHRARELPIGTAKLLSMGAVVGQSFDLNILAYMVGETTEEIKEQLKEAVSLEIINPRGLGGGIETELFTFCHDRFQQAYYTMLGEGERLQSHLKIATFYEQKLLGEALSAERTLKIAENYAKGLSAIEDKLERGRVAKLVLEAVRISAGLSAFDTAMCFLEILLTECKDVQEEDTQFQFCLYAAYHSTLCSLARCEEADVIYEKLKKIMKDPLDMTEVCCDQAVILSNRGKYADAIALGIRFLEVCGIQYPGENLKEAVEEELNAYYIELNEIGFDGIESIGETSDLVQYAVNKVANRIFAASLFGNPLDSFWLAVTTSRRILKNGYTPDGLQLYANQVVPLIFLRQDYKTPCLSAVAAIKIAEKRNYRNVLGRFYHCYSLMCHHWYKGLREGLTFARSAFENGVEVGDFEFACYSFCTTQEILLETSKDIDELHLETNAGTAYAKKHNNNHALQIYINYEQLYKSLKGQTEGNGSFNDDDYKEEVYLESVAQNAMAKFFYNTLRALTAILFADMDTAYTLTEQAISYEPYVTAFYVTAQRRFLHAIALCEKVAKADYEKEQREILWEKLEDDRKWFKDRVLDAAMNFEHMYLAIEAGAAALEDRNSEALMWYNKAAGAAKDNAFTCHAALIMELAGRHLIKMKAEDIAALYIKEACLGFLTWGAVAKTEQMKQLYPKILVDDSVDKVGENKMDSHTTGNLATVTLDLDAIIKASQAITKEIHLEDILKQLMSVLLENASAQDIFFLTGENGDFEIRAQGHGRGETLDISTELSKVVKDLPCQIINYVFRTGESVVLDSINATDRFGKDEYFEEHVCKSVMCLPVVNKGKLRGILYLENNIIEGAFHKDRINFLDVLTAQLAISLENAQLYDNIYRLAYYDSLTELPNRTSVYEELAKYSEGYAENAKRYAVLLIDLDNFKAINDTFGHTFGDMLLQKLGIFLKNFTASRGIVSRIGGDEFLIAVTEDEWVGKPEILTKELLEKLSHPLYVESIELHISISVGIAVYPDNGETLETLMRNADTALYSAKEDGKNTYKRFSEEMQSKAAKRLDIENKLRRAIRNQEFIVYYQPKVDGQTGRTVGAEALVRWNSPALGVVSPIQFISVAEDSGVIIPIDEIVLIEACRMAKSLQDAGMGITISVNKSAVHFKKRGIVDRIRYALEKEKLDPRFLEIEITESAAMQDLESTIGILNELRNIGVKVSLDDFGTGYSSLSHLRRLPITTLKIDKSFIDGVGKGQNEAAIVESLIDLAHKIHLTVVAEGVESKEQFQFLKKKSCDLIQGYYFSKPLSENAFWNRMLAEKERCQ